MITCLLPLVASGMMVFDRGKFAPSKLAWIDGSSNAVAVSCWTARRWMPRYGEVEKRLLWAMPVADWQALPLTKKRAVAKWARAILRGTARLDRPNVAALKTAIGGTGMHIAFTDDPIAVMNAWGYVRRRPAWDKRGR